MIKSLKLFLFFNLVFLIYFFHRYLFLPNSALSILINLMIFIIPGYCYANFFKNKISDLISIIFLTICISTIILISGCLFFYVFKITLSPVNFLLFLIIITNTGLLILKLLNHNINRNIKLKFLTFTLIFTAILYLSLYISATRIVPPLEDHDMEAQGTAFGIMHYLKPYMVTNRGTVYYFAHPLLLHFYIGNTFLFLNELDDLSYYYKSAISAEKELEENNSKELLFKNWHSDLRRFFGNPHLLATRMPNIFLGAISSIVLFYLIYLSTKSFIFSMAGPFIYFTFPEIFVRSAYGDYIAITNFSLLIMAYLYIYKDNLEIHLKYKQAILFIAGLFGALTDQKTVIFIIAVGIRELLSENISIWNRLKRSLSEKIIQGYVFGTMFFWLYGFIVNKRAFVEDHITYHIANRFSLDDVRLAPSKIISYPSIIELWKEFNNHLGFPFLIIAIPLTIYTIKSIKNRKSILGLWFSVGAVLFSITDWRQTKHLMHILPPLVISTLIFISGKNLWLKTVFIIIFAFLVYNNIGVILKLSKDFSTISPTPIW